MLWNVFASDDITHEPTIDYSRTVHRTASSDLPGQSRFQLPGGFPKSWSRERNVDRSPIPAMTRSVEEPDMDGLDDVLSSGLGRLRSNNAFLRQLDSAADASMVDLQIPDKALADLQRRYDELRESSLRDLDMYSSFYESYKELLVKHNDLLRRKRPAASIESVRSKITQIRSVSTQLRVKNICDELIRDLEAESYKDELEMAKQKIASLERQLAGKEKR